MTKRKTSEQFINAATEIHGNVYDYSSVVYTTALTKVSIICKAHGIFNQRPNDHLNGVGCPCCGQINRQRSNTKSTLLFIQRANVIHGSCYNYTQAIYTGLHKPLTIICKEHGEFEQTPNSHIHCRAGCPKCSHTCSHKERAWLTQCGVPDTKLNRQVKLKVGGRYIKVDGYIPETKTIYEFYGDYWHGNPTKYNANDVHPGIKTTFGDLYKNTIIRKNHIEQHGYNVVDVWESEFTL